METVTDSNEAPSPPRPPSIGDAQRDLDKRNDQELKDWVLGLRAGPSIKIVLKRIWPKKADDGTPVVGKCDDYDEPVSEDEIKERHGGGKYEVIVHKPSPKGGWIFFKQATIEIPGKPDFTPVLGPGYTSARAAGAEPISHVDRVLSSSEKQIEDARRAQRVAEDRAEKLLTQTATSTGIDPQVLSVLQAPLLEELRNQRAHTKTLEDRLTQVMTSKPDNSAQERFFEKMVDGGQQQMQQIRTQHDSELRQLRENHIGDMRRLEDRHEKAMDRLMDSHKREISGLERSQAQELKATEMAFNGRIDQLKSDISRLERELAAKDIELARLRALKEKSPMEALEDAVKIKEHLVDLGMAADPDDKDDEDEKVPGWVKGLTVLLDNPVAQGFAERLAGGGGAAAAPQQQQVDFAALSKSMNPGQAVQLQDGRVVIKRHDGQLVMMTAEQAQQVRQQRKAQLAKKRAEKGAATPDASGNSPPAPLRIAKEDLAKVVKFIEGAITNGTTPEQFAQTAATLAPKSVMQAIKRQTVEWFLEQADVEDASSINTQAGRDWLRQLSTVLKGPST